MSEVALALMILFGAICGGLIVWMVMQLRYQDLRGEFVDLYEDYQRSECELEAVYGRYAEWMARALANETRVAWLTKYMQRLDQELELERVVSDAYAAGIQREET